MLNLELSTQEIEYMPSARFFVLAVGSKAVSELSDIVGQQFYDLDRAGSMHLDQEFDPAATV